MSDHHSCLAPASACNARTTCSHLRNFPAVFVILLLFALCPTTVIAQVMETWVTRYGSSNGSEYPVAVAADVGGNVYVAGTNYYATSNSTTGTAFNYATVKYGSSGTLLWEAQFGYEHTSSLFNQARSMAIDGSGNVYVTGSSLIGGFWRSTPSYDIETVKYSTDGVLLWRAHYCYTDPVDGACGPYNKPYGGDDTPYQIVTDSQGNVYVVGTSNRDIVTIKYDTNGNQLWVARYNGSDNGEDNAIALEVDLSGNVYVTGNSYSATTGYDFLTIKYDADGHELWATRYNGPGNGFDGTTGIAIDSAGNVYVAGSSYADNTYNDSDYAIVKYDGDGNQLWVARYNGLYNDNTAGMTLDHVGNIYVTGQSQASVGSYDYDYATVKYDSNGNQMWIARYNGPANLYDSPKSLAVDSAGNIYVTGFSFSDSIYYDYATVKYDSNGNQLWVARYNGPGNAADMATAIAVDSANVYVTGFSISAASDTDSDYATIKYSQSPSTQLPQTGQTTCYDAAGAVIPCAGTAQDGEIQAGVPWPTPRFTDHSDGTVTDNLAGLMWTKDANLPGTSSTWQQALNYVAAMNAGTYPNLGFTDWRLPNIHELESLVDEGAIPPIPPRDHPFSNVQSTYWTSTTYPFSSSDAWNITISYGGRSATSKSSSYYLWPVRSGIQGVISLPKSGQTIVYAAGDDGDVQAGAAWPQPRLTSHVDGTVTDDLTGLMWPSNANLPGSSTLTWQDTLNYVAGMNSGGNPNLGYTDWRLPNIRELLSLIDYGHINPALPSPNPFFNYTYDISNRYWSSTSKSNEPNNVWGVRILFGDSSPVPKSFKGYYYLLPVRGGQVTKTPAPVVSGLTPNTGAVGISVTITGLNFGVSQGTSGATFNGVTAAVSSWTDTQILATVPSGAATGPVVVTVNGVPSNNDQIFTVLPADFTLSPSPLTQTVDQGSSTSYTVAVQDLNGFSSPVALSLTVLSSTGMPEPRIAASVSINPVTPPGTTATTLTITPSASVPSGSYTVAIQAVGGGLTHTTSVTVTVTIPVPDFTIVPDAGTDLPLKQGGSVSTNLIVNPVGGFDASMVVFRLMSYLPDRVNLWFSLNPALPGQSTKLTIDADTDASTSQFQIVVRAEGGGILKDLTFNINLQNLGSTDLKGKITNGNTQDDPIPDALVVLYETDGFTETELKRTLTNSRGAYLFEGQIQIDIGKKYIISAYAQGFEEKRGEFPDPNPLRLIDNLNLRKNLGLIPTACSLPTHTRVYALDGSDLNNPNRTPLILIHGIHGIGGTWNDLITFVNNQDDLRTRFKIYLYDYQSNLCPIVSLGQGLRDWIDRFPELLDINKPMMIIAHSMGGLVARSYMNEYRHQTDGTFGGQHVSKLMTLATPHHGTVVVNEDARDNALKPFQGWKAATDAADLFLFPATAFDVSGPNRDLRSDDFDGYLSPCHLSPLGCESDVLEENLWLINLNGIERFAHKILAYRTFLDIRDPRRIRVFESGVTGPAEIASQILQSQIFHTEPGEQSEQAVSYLLERGLKRSAVPEKILADSMLIEPTAIDGPYAYNDGVVPVQSADFSNVAIQKAITFCNFTHTQLPKVAQVFGRLRSDLLEAAEAQSPPVITCLFPMASRNGPVMTIYGDQFSSIFGTTTVTINGISIPVEKGDNNKIQIRLPSNVQLGDEVRVVVEGVSSNAVVFRGLEMTYLRDQPDPFSPNGDGNKDSVSISVSSDQSLDWGLTIPSEQGPCVNIFMGSGASFSAAWNPSPCHITDGLYYYEVSGKNAAGDVVARGFGDVLVDNTPPTAPPYLTAFATGSNSIEIRWTAASDSVGIGGYHIYRDGGTNWIATTTVTETSTGTSYVDTGLAANSPHTYTVAAVDTAGNESAKSPSASATTYNNVAATSVSQSTVTYGITTNRSITIYGSGFALGARITVGSLSGVMIAGTTATATTPFVFTSSSQVKFYWPNTALPPGIYDVQVTNPNGVSGVLVGGFTVLLPQPTLSSLSQSSVTYGITSSASITIYGSDFVSGATISVDGVSGATVPGSIATSTSPFVFVSNSQLKFYWANTAIPLGAYAVTVTNPTVAGGLSVSLADAFTVLPPAPTVTSASPSPVIYDVSTSQSITIYGTNFVSGAMITVGSVTGPTVPGSIATAATPFVYVSNSQLKFYWDKTALLPGAYAVQVINPPAAGGVAGSLAAGFTVAVAQPTVTSLSSTSVTYGISPSTSMTIYGDQFVLGATITVGSLSGPTVAGSTASAATPFVFVSRGQLKFYWPNTSLPPGTYDVQVTNTPASGNLSATLANGLNVAAPQPTVTSTSLTPVTYGISPSASITIYGSNFLVGATITVGSLTGTTVAGSTATATTRFVHVSSSQVKFYWPNTSLPLGAYAVQVTNPAAAGSLGASLADGFTVAAPQPTVTSVGLTPVTYGISPSASITIYGSNFVLGATLTVGSLTGTTVAGSTATATTRFVHVSGSQLKLYWPNTALPPAAYAVQVINPATAGGLSATLANGFTVAAPQPAVTSVSPTPVTYGTTSSGSIAIYGSNFIVGATITVGSLTGTTVAGSTATATTRFVHVSGSQLKFYWPNTALPPAAYAVQVTNPATAGGLSATLANGFTVAAPQPAVTSVSPTPVTYGTTSSGSITIYGSNFIVGATITVGSLAGTTVAGSTATATARFVYVNSSQLKFYWGNTSLPVGGYTVSVTNPPSASGAAGSLANGFVVQ